MCTRASRPTRPSRCTCSAVVVRRRPSSPRSNSRARPLPTIEVIVNPEDIEYDEGSAVARRSSKITDQVATIIENYAIREPKQGAIHKLFLHFFENPVEVLGEDGKVVGLRTERTELDGTGNVKPTGKTTDWEIGAVYRAVGYLSDSLPEIPFDSQAGVIPNEAGRIFDEGAHLPGLYTTGWIKRGPVGLIGHTKGDANETVQCTSTTPPPTS